ncbi:rhodanese-like domain-containing protein [Allokutzneria sp. NRRL B-24872]|uniref:rhodanese-like domain-containing protein n=1 Tax=Allokutzneria sp. NRRL B-24872 TaxID=1137961 RepID=UPI000A3CF06D|nr:rhodanese-like domain-containing protein [Allokutzneria sp. NRRL B-24872]
MSIDKFLDEARAEIDRLEPEQAFAAQQDGALIVDIRPHSYRAEEGEIPGALPIERIHLEWRLDPAGSHRIPEIRPDSVVVVVCNEGYSSSLAARDLRRVGLNSATDLVGGFRGWQAAGLPTKPGGTPAIP